MAAFTQRQKIYQVIFGTSTRAGQIFDIVLIIAILSSEAILILSSVTVVETRFPETLFYAEWLFTLLFTIEYITRLYCSPKPIAYARSFYGIIDLLAIIPAYVAFFIPGSNYLLIIRLIRVLRIFRILKLARYLRDSNILLRSLRQAQRKIFVFFSSVLILVTVFGSLMFVIEGPDNGFTSIPQSIYWAIVTITTVGYGDMIPHTVMGKALASLTMLLGYSILAVPTGIITAELSQEMKTHREFIRCPNCATSGHETDAEYCKKCGTKLPEHL
ncbi:ion transporter [Photobacterium profundum]|uniref:Potassium channel n=1 Tax=Photobacterium profundum 3TCK TaxID=314280 RepID=Q1Z5J1_9GAMM|nr:ion transporter [Photobacterium profundum]EAS43891.1 Putative potassium channel [Photobacterium profundum 3TCK]PSV64409.1 ion transporter [Photobacterium profundum]